MSSCVAAWWQAQRHGTRRLTTALAKIKALPPRKALADDIKAEYKAGCGAYGIRCNV